MDGLFGFFATLGAAELPVEVEAVLCGLMRFAAIVLGFSFLIMLSVCMVAMIITAIADVVQKFKGSDTDD